MNRPRGRNRKAENSSNGAGFDNRRKGIFIINTMLLREAMIDPTSFVAS
jgi:hypothetical protein